MLRLSLFILFGIAFNACGVRQPTVYTSEKLVMIQETANTYRHVSFLNTESWGKVPCNGLVYFNEGVAYVFDTPVDDSSSMELFSWIESRGASVAAVFINHFHDDCLGGLSYFHEKGVVSYATNLTIEIATQSGLEAPQVGFKDTLILQFGKDFIVCRYLGPAHTTDNMVSYIGSEKVLFGGCMIKSLGAGRGNLADADTLEWANTVTNVRDEFDKAKIIVPGHGNSGGRELLDYTIEMFQ